MTIGIVIPVLNNFEQAQNLVNSLDNRGYKIYIQHQYKSQVSLAAAWNNGISQAITDKCDYIAILNDDILLAPNCLERMAFMFSELEPNVILVSANNIFSNFENPKDILQYSEPENDITNATDHPNYACFMVKRDFFDKHGKFDENFWPAWWEDNDSHYRIHLLGLRAICTTYASCIHYGGQTIKNDPGRAISGISEQYFEDKWGSKNRDMKEKFITPYNDPKLTPRDWHPNMI